VRKVAKRAGVAAPAVAVAGALAAAPHLHSLTASAPRVTGAPTARLAYPVQAANAASALPASQSRAEYRARHARKPASRPHPHHSAAPAPSPAPSASAKPTAGTGQQAAAPPASTGNLSCSASASGPLPANYAAIVGFLTSHGYTGNAAAGIAGNIYQESGGNPESEGDGGGGLIGWTPLPGGYVTGNPAADAADGDPGFQQDLVPVRPRAERRVLPGCGGRHLRHRLRAGRRPRGRHPRGGRRGRRGGLPDLGRVAKGSW
jgi:hypothetical protein